MYPPEIASWPAGQVAVPAWVGAPAARLTTSLTTLTLEALRPPSTPGTKSDEVRLPSATLADVTAEFWIFPLLTAELAIFAAWTAPTAILSALTAPLAILAVVTAPLRIFAVVTDPFASVAVVTDAVGEGGHRGAAEGHQERGHRHGVARCQVTSQSGLHLSTPLRR